MDAKERVNGWCKLTFIVSELQSGADTFIEEIDGGVDTDNNVRVTSR